MLEIKGFQIGRGQPCFIVAEIGQNHQGEMEIAKKMIRIAKECGVNCVKFQKTTLTSRFNQDALDAPYHDDNAFGSTYGDHRAYLEFSESDFRILKAYADEVGIMFSASCMDIPASDFLNEISVPFMKIGSGDTNNPLLIEHVARMNVPVILSTGMSDLETVKKAYTLLKKYHSNFALLHCVSAYPTPPQDVNLSVLGLYRRTFPDVPVGYSGHEEGTAIAIAAVAMGAKIIEKHFTLDKSQKGTDHKCSLNPNELRQLVYGIRTVELAIGNPVKSVLPSEEPCQVKLGKTLVAARLMKKGSTIQQSDIAIKVARPRGLQPKVMDLILGAKILSNIQKDSPITQYDIEVIESNRRTYDYML